MIRVAVSEHWERGIAGAASARLKAVTDAANDMQRHSQAVVPVDTGTLKRSVQQDVKQTATTSTGEVSYNTDYAIYVEMGTYKMAAQPYLHPAYVVGKNALIRNLSMWLRTL